MLIKKEYDFRERVKCDCSMEESSIFTVHNLDTTDMNGSEDDLSKSSILAPFNSNETDEDKFMKSVEPMIVSRKIIKFCSKLREANRQYERDNNSNIDNGVYVQQVFTNSKHKSYSTKSTASNTMQSCSNQINIKVVAKMEQMGLGKSFVLDSLKGNMHNNATACYYLLCDN